MKFKEIPSVKQVAFFEPGASLSRSTWRELPGAKAQGAQGAQEAQGAQGLSRTGLTQREAKVKPVLNLDFSGNSKNYPFYWYENSAPLTGRNVRGSKYQQFNSLPDQVSTKNVMTPRQLPERKETSPLLKDSYAILDLDHTLINTETTEKPNLFLEENCDFHFKLQGHHYYVFKRPGVDKFIDTLIKNFNGIAVWTAAMATYAKQIIKGLFGIKKAPNLILIWTRCQTQNNEEGLYKALTKLWNDPVYGNYMNPENTVHIDNTESVMRHNPNQALLVPDFHYYKVEKKPTISPRNGQSIAGFPVSNVGGGRGLLASEGKNVKISFNNTDNYLIYLDDLIKELVKTKKDTLKNFIERGNLLTKWYLKTHPLII